MEVVHYWRALHQVAMAMSASLEPPDVLRAIVEETAGAIEAKGCSLMLLSPDGRELRHSAWHGLSSRYVGKGAIPTDQDMVEALQGRSLVIADVTTDPRIRYRREAVEEGIVSMLSVPIRLRGEVIGVLRVYTDEPREFPADSLEFLEAIASLGAIAMENASRYTEVKVDREALAAYIHRYGGA